MSSRANAQSSDLSPGSMTRPLNENGSRRRLCVPANSPGSRKRTSNPTHIERCRSLHQPWASTQAGFDQPDRPSGPPEPAWLTERRRRSWSAFESAKWPASNKDEEWMRTDARLFKIGEILRQRSSAIDVSAGADALLARGVELGGRVESVPTDGRSFQKLDESILPTKESSSVAWARRSLTEHVTTCSRSAFAREVVSPTYDRFAMLNDAFWTGGVVLHVPKGVRIEKPLHAISRLTGQARLGREQERSSCSKRAPRRRSLMETVVGRHRPPPGFPVPAYTVARSRSLSARALEAPLREPAELERSHVALRPSEGDRRTRKPNCNGPSAPSAPGWRR